MASVPINNFVPMTRTDHWIHLTNRLGEKMESVQTAWLARFISGAVLTKGLSYLIGVPYLIMLGIGKILAYYNRHTIQLGDLGGQRLPNRDYTIQGNTVRRHPFQEPAQLA